MSLALGASSEPIHDVSAIVSAVIAFANGDTRPPWFARVSRVPDKVLGLEAALTEVAAINLREYGPGNEDVSAVDATAARIRSPAKTGRWLKPGVSTSEPFQWENTLDVKGARHAASEIIQEERTFAVETLDAAARGASKLSQWLQKADIDDSGLSTVHLIPDFRHNTDATISLLWKIQGERTSSVPWVKFAALLLVATSTHDDQLDVGRCHFEDCRRFFLIDWLEGNRPRTKYCCPAHRIEHHKARATERKRRSRAGKRPK